MCVFMFTLENRVDTKSLIQKPCKSWTEIEPEVTAQPRNYVESWVQICDVVRNREYQLVRRQQLELRLLPHF